MSITHPPEQVPQQPDPNEWSAVSFSVPGADPMNDTGEIAGLPIAEGQNWAVPPAYPQQVWAPPAASFYAGAPQSPEASPPLLPSPNHRGRNRLIGALTAGAVLIGGGVIAGKELFGRDAKTTATAHHPTGSGNSGQTPPPTTLSPTSILKPKGTLASNGRVKANIDLITVVGKDTELNVGGAPVPECQTDPSIDPVAKLNAFLADYSYFLSASQEADANTASLAITTDSVTTSGLINLRNLWQANHPNQMLWFWSDPKSPVEFTTRNNTDNTETLSAKGTIYYKAFPKVTDGTWEAPTLLSTDGAARMPGIELTYTYWNRNTYQGTRGNLVGSQVDGADSHGSKLVLPIL